MMMSPATRPAPGRRADYTTFTPITTRWMDNDVFGHLNNVVYYSFFDTAVTRALVARGILTWHGGSHFLVVAESGCRFLSELAFPETIEAGIRLARLGERSMRHEIGVFRAGEDTASAEGFMVHVCVDSETRRPASLPEAWRTALQPTPK
jgi:acyl-CoA thioester hydrolase